jgi:hypothetical protein
MTETAPKNWKFEPSDDPKLADEVYSTRLGDLIEKLEAVLKEANYPPEEVIPALGCVLSIRFVEADDPNRMFRIFIAMLSEKFDEVMSEYEN